MASYTKISEGDLAIHSYFRVIYAYTCVANIDRSDFPDMYAQTQRYRHMRKIVTTHACYMCYGNNAAK